MKFLDREPAVIIGIVASCVLAVAQVLNSEGLLSGDLVAVLTSALDPTNGWVVPLILAIVTRFAVYSPARAKELRAEVPEGYVPAPVSPVTEPVEDGT